MASRSGFRKSYYIIPAWTSMVFELVPAMVLFVVSALAGVIGALVGIGGGVILIPFLVLIEGVPIHYAIGASIVAVVATSSASASAYVKSRLSNPRLGMFLEAGTSIGALIGALISVFLPVGVLEILFSLMALYVCVSMLIPKNDGKGQVRKQDGLSDRLCLHSSYELKGEKHEYMVCSSGLGLAGSAIAGVLSGLFGIGGGVIKVPLMNLGMGVPLRPAAATSNFMIGVTAATGAAVFFSRGYIIPELVAPIVVGIAAGSILGSTFSHRVDTGHLRILFVAVLFLTALRMLLQALGVSLGF
jgi:uncharacterized membrane protein YfcA